MRKKQLIAASVVLIVLVVLSLLSRDKKTTSNVSPGDIVFEGVKESELDRIVLNSTAAGAETEIINKDNRWLIKNRFNMDCDPSVMRKLFAAVKESKAIHVINHTKEDLKLFLLSEENTVKLDFYKKGSEKPVSFRLGKSHSFKQEHTGRYVYIPEKEALVLVDLPLAFVAGQPSVWLKKFLPYHEQVAGVTFYAGNNLLWKTERNGPAVGFSMPLPKSNNMTPQKINQLMFYAMQLRFMDIVPATNDFTVSKELQGMALYYSTFAGRTYKLSFLNREQNKLRCSIRLISNKVKTQFKKDYGSDEALKDELLEWHFTVPYKFYEELYRL